MPLFIVYALQPWSTTENEAANFADLEIVITNLLTLVTPFAGLAVFIMLLLGGFKFLTSGGNPENVAKAKQTITMALAGLFLLIGAWFVLLFIKQFTGVDVTEFNIPRPS